MSQYKFTILDILDEGFIAIKAQENKTTTTKERERESYTCALMQFNGRLQ